MNKIFLSIIAILLSLAVSCSGGKETKTSENKEKEQEQKEGGKLGGPSSEPVSVDIDGEKLIKKLRQSADTVIIQFERTPCFGRCPIDKLTIYDNGYTVYEGKRNVEKEGSYYTVIKSSKRDKVFEVAEKIGFWEMKKKYDSPKVTDVPSKIIRLRKGNKDHKVVNRYGGPQELEKLQEALVNLIESEGWKKTSVEEN